MCEVGRLEQGTAQWVVEVMRLQGPQEGRSKAAHCCRGLVVGDVAGRENSHLHILPGTGAEHLTQGGICLGQDLGTGAGAAPPILPPTIGHNQGRTELEPRLS